MWAKLNIANSCKDQHILIQIDARPLEFDTYLAYAIIYIDIFIRFWRNQ